MTSESASGLPDAAQPRSVPVVIVCPYLRDEDATRVRQAFGLDDARGRDLPFFLWQDVEGLGPERAYQHCWSQFPDHDVVIIHTDMSPMPDDADNRWYRELLGWVDRLPDAGLVACDLLYPIRARSGRWYVQSAGGKVEDGEISWIGGHVDARTGSVGEGACEYDASYQGAREADWVTFGGVYLRRRVIERCGGLDPRYRWAYVMDVDYCMLARLHGFKCYQVPVNLLHEENGSTRELLADPVHREAMLSNFDRFRSKWFPEVEIGRLKKEFDTQRAGWEAAKAAQVDQQRREREAAQAEIERLRARVDRQQREREAAGAEIARLNAHADGQRRAREVAEEEIARLQARLDGQQREGQAAKAELGRTQERLAERDAELARVYASWSLRLTAPLRRLNPIRRALGARFRRAAAPAADRRPAEGADAPPRARAEAPGGIDIRALLADIRAELGGRTADLGGGDDSAPAPRGRLHGLWSRLPLRTRILIRRAPFFPWPEPGAPRPSERRRGPRP